ncbi:MAG: DUF2786 domain-containing protein [Neisseriaceae bacterium]|nr:DUF2786 domain-containing protein [Neisseriaceae bacterium]
MTDENILRKIKKCLALSKSSNEHEAAQALKMAMAMMEKHGFNQIDVALSDIAEARGQAVQKRTTEWQWRLAALCTKAFGCSRMSKFFRETGRRHMVFIGPADRAQLAVYAFEVLLRQLKSARRQFLKDHVPAKATAKEKTFRADEFSNGWIFAISGKVHAFAKPAGEEELIKTYMDQKVPGLKTVAGKTVKPSIGMARRAEGDFYSGMDASSDVHLNHAMKGQGGVATITQQ